MQKLLISPHYIPETHEEHSEVKPVCMLSEPSSSLHMLTQTFAGLQVTQHGLLCVCLDSRVAKTGGNYLQI